MVNLLMKQHHSHNEIIPDKCTEVMVRMFLKDHQSRNRLNMRLPTDFFGLI